MLSLPVQTAHVQAHVSPVQVRDEFSDRAILPFAFIDRAQFSQYRRRLWERDPTCTYCHKPIASGKETLDHIIPKKQGGIDTPANLVLACERCNQAKDSRSLAEWAADIVQACVETGQPYANGVEGGVA